MKIIEFTAELHGNRDVTLNGRRVEDSEPLLEEKAIFKTLTLDQQWMLLCHVRKMLNKLDHTYHKSRVRAGELSMSELDSASRSRHNVSSGSLGVEGTSIRKL